MKQTCALLAFALTLIVHHAAAQQRLAVSGKVTDEKSAPISGALVRILNSSHSAAANNAGEFLLQDVPAGTHNFQVSAAGFATIIIESSVSQSQGSLVFTLLPVHRQLDAVVVSAQKREEVLQRLPLSVTALTERQVQEFRLWDVKELSGIVPGLYADDPGDKRSVISIRGITTTSYDPAVAVYIDGVNQFNLDTYISPLFDVERIEVLRGPQGTLYGRNAMGGVVNIITKQPTNRATGFAEATLGRYGQQRYSAGVKAPLIKDKLFVGAAGLYDRFNGYYTNAFNNSRYDRQHTAGGNYYLRFLPGRSWNIALNVKHTNNRNNGPFPLVFGAEQAFADPFVLNQNATTKMIDNIFNTSLSVNHTGRTVNVSSQTAYQSNYRYYTNPIDGDFSPIDGITVINNYGKEWNRVRVFTQELRLSNAAASAARLQWVAGAYFFHQNSPVKQATRFGNDAALVGAPDVNFSLINSTRAKSTGGALYAQATVALGNGFDLVGGLRYDREQRKQNILGEYQKDPDPQPLFAYRPDTAASATFGAFSPKVGLVYKPSATQTWFTTFSRGFRAGGLTPISSDPSQPALFAFKPEYSNNIEAGSKQQFWNNKLQLNVTLFYANVTNAQVPTLVLPDAVTITRNTGKLTSRGIETEMQARPADGLAILHSFGYTRATFQNLQLSANGSVINLKGNRQVFTPDLTSMLAVQYSHFLNRRAGLSLVLRGEWKYLGTQYFDLANTIRQSPYNLYNTRIGITAKHWSVFGWGRNLFDQRYIGYAYDFGAVNLGDPRTYGVTVGMRF